MRHNTRSKCHYCSLEYESSHVHGLLLASYCYKIIKHFLNFLDAMTPQVSAKGIAEAVAIVGDILSDITQIVLVII